ncbi:hypothetical protein NXS19_003290 [Fusarium pseudograminearum]|nr:hypothetical protein NXS19_003290 [Fusarium pseudograminearum]
MRAASLRLGPYSSALHLRRSKPLPRASSLPPRHRRPFAMVSSSPKPEESPSDEQFFMNSFQDLDIQGENSLTPSQPASDPPTSTTTTTNNNNKTTTNS